VFTLRQELNFYTLLEEQTVRCLRQLVAGLSPWKPGFNAVSDHASFVLVKVTFVSEYFCFLLSIIFLSCSLLILFLILAYQKDKRMKPEKFKQGIAVFYKVEL
jgi:hypothetical protein